MYNCSIFGVEIQSKTTNNQHNVIKVTNKKEIFYDVFECILNGEKIIVEKIDEYNGLPVVSFELKIKNKIYNCEAVLVQENQSGLFLNGKTLKFVKKIEQPSVKKVITEEVEKVIPVNTVYEDKVRDVSEKIIKESEEKAQKLYDNRIKDYKKQKQLITNLAEKTLYKKVNSLIESNINSKIEDLNEELKVILHHNDVKISKLGKKIEDIKPDTLLNTILENNELVERVDHDVKKILTAELSNINEKLNIFSEEEDKKYKQLLDNINNLDRGEVKEILSEKISDKQINSLKLDISRQFQNEMTSIKRLVEMSSGGGTVAKQFANGGTMNGDLNVTGELKADTIVATTLLSAGTIDTNYELSGFSATGDISANGDLYANNLDATGELNVEGYSEFNKRVDINTNHGGTGLRIKSSLPSNPSSNLVVEGTATIGHDLFKQSGFSGGFASGSNHFHNLTIIDRISNSSDDALNILRVQEKYYAIPSNFLRNNKAAFWAWHKVARTVNIWNGVNLSAATLDVSALQNSSNRSSDSQVPFITNTTPLNKSEPVVVTLPGHDISLGQNVRMQFSTSFEGPIVAAALFGKVSAVTSNTFSIELYGGNYKTTQEVPLGTDQTTLSPDSVSLTKVVTENAVNPNNQVSLSHYSKTNFSPDRLTDETLKATWDIPHNLVQNEHIVFITDGRGDLDIFKDGWVLDADPDGDGLSAIIIYGNRLNQADLAPFTAFDGSGWTLYKGSFDGIHNETVGDILLNFDSDNVGNYKAFQLGPGCQTDSDCIAIGKNVYNKDASTVKIGYDNAMLNIKSDGIDVNGHVQADNIYGSVYPIWAEESSDIGDNAHEWAYGNGDDTPAKQGIPIAFKSKLLKVSLNVEVSSGNTTTEDIEVEVYKNGVATGAKGVITQPLSYDSSKKSQVEDVSSLNVVFDENDVINFRTVKDGNVNVSSARVCAWLQTIL